MSGLSYAACCRTVHVDIRTAAAPEQVVRARFSAQVLGDMAFFRQSIIRKHRNLPHVDAFAETIARQRYERIAITNARRVGWFNRKATVVCRIYDAGRRHVSAHTERIHLKREERAWRVVTIDLVTAQSSPGAARNAPCPCGSGKKYKRCCGNHESALPGATTDRAA